MKWIRDDEWKERKSRKSFVLIVDEVDDLHRTELKESNDLAQMEKAYKKLLKMGFRLRFGITATPLSVWKEILEHPKGRETIDIFTLEPDCTYVGVHDLDTRNETFLCDKELCDYAIHPYTSTKTIKFYEEALTLPKGVLVCNIANPKVVVEENVRIEADEGMFYFFGNLDFSSWRHDKLTV